MVVKCPLCLRSDCTKIDQLDRGTLKKEYIRFLGKEVASLFNNLATDINFYVCSTCKLYFFYPHFVGDAKFYEALAKFSWYYLQTKQEYNYVLPYLPKKGKLLEVGCGNGAFANFSTAMTYTGLEINEHAAKAGQDVGRNIQISTVPAFARSHKEEFDVVCSFQVLEHIEMIHEFISESLACLKPGGLFIFSIPSNEAFFKFSHNNLLNMPPHHQSRWDDRTIYYLSELFHIRLISVHHDSLDPLHYSYYLYTMLTVWGRKFLTQSTKVLNNTLAMQVYSKLALFLARAIAFPFKALRLKSEFMPMGHSVTAVFEKL